MALLDAAPIATARRAADLLAVLDPSGARPSVAAVTAVLREYGEPDPIRLTRADVDALRTAAALLHEVFAAEDVAESVGLLNSLLTRYGTTPRLTAHDGTPWHLHVDTDDDGPWDEWFVASSAMALATLTAERQSCPAGLCASLSCGRPFVDDGRGSTRRYCSPRCATRERVAAHRAGRQRAGQQRANQLSKK